MDIREAWIGRDLNIAIVEYQGGKKGILSSILLKKEREERILKEIRTSGKALFYQGQVCQAMYLASRNHTQINPEIINYLYEEDLFNYLMLDSFLTLSFSEKSLLMFKEWERLLTERRSLITFLYEKIILLSPNEIPEVEESEIQELIELTSKIELIQLSNFYEILKQKIRGKLKNAKEELRKNVVKKVIFSFDYSICFVAQAGTWKKVDLDKFEEPEEIVPEDINFKETNLEIEGAYINKEWLREILAMHKK